MRTRPLLLFLGQRWHQGLQQHPAVVRRLAERFRMNTRDGSDHRVQLEPERLDGSRNADRATIASSSSVKVEIETRLRAT
jgi:hypothetical protein